MLRTGCGSAWLERLVWDQEVAGSNPVTPIEIGIFHISNVRVQFNGRTPAFQAGYVGSIPITRSLSLQLSWIEQRPSKPWVGGSNPSRLVLWWVQRSWLARQIVALEAKGSNPFIHLIGLSPSGKAQHFDCCIRWFESSQPSQRKPAGQSADAFTHIVQIWDISSVGRALDY